MRVGINFPWVSCGHDFGPRPPAWGGDVGPRDWGEVERELAALREIGVTLTRWWVLAGGTNYPVGEDPARYARLVETGDGWLHASVDALLGEGAGDLARRALPSRRYRAFALDRGARLPSLPDAFLRDFRGLLRACANAGVPVVPSLLSFEMFQPALVLERGVVKRGRRAFVFDDLDAFLDGTLGPLLDAAADVRDGVFAFEVINEPDWAVRGGPIQIDRGAYGLTPTPHWVPEHEMSELVRRGVQRIASAGFTATVGFEDGRAPWLRDDVRAQLAELAARGHYLHQHHHYPTALSDRTLVPASELPVGPTMLGEFPTAMANGADNVRWRDARAERDPERYLEERLVLIEARGYAGALLWSARSADSRRAWGDLQRRQVARFAANHSTT